jgi:DNA-binding CsgD family transcriptional regulator
MQIPRTLSAKSPRLRRSLFLVAAGLQIGCGMIFLMDVIVEWKHIQFHGVVEALAVLGLAVGAVLTLREYRSLLRRNTKVERELNAVTGAFQEEIERHFDHWGLTAAERDVALLSIKGVSISDIAAMRSTRDGTIKAQSAAIYRKAGVSGRAELISVVVEELVSGLKAQSET